MKILYDQLSHKTSKATTRLYSTSFSMGIFLLDKNIHAAIHGIYGWVRVADEIVDSFHGFDKEQLLIDFRKDTEKAIGQKISTNPIIHSFQWVVNEYDIGSDLINTFLDSMEMDLNKNDYDQIEFQQYILGSAEVVGLMCLKVFVDGDNEQYKTLKPYAMRLGAAFQKINFLRDLREDYLDMGRSYFPEINLNQFDNEQKVAIEKEIKEDFDEALIGIKKLPKSAKLGVYAAYIYYISLFKKIKIQPASELFQKRIRVSNFQKICLTCFSFLRLRLNWI